jgi:type IV pilus assembly protein PilV
MPYRFRARRVPSYTRKAGDYCVDELLHVTSEPSKGTHTMQAWPYRLRGISLLEVLIALLVLSVGMIGLASLLVFVGRAGQVAMIRTQVAFLAENMIERMRANPIGVWKGFYNASFPLSGNAPACGGAAPCPAPAVAERDKLIWSDLLRSHLADVGDTSIHCDHAGIGFTPDDAQIARRPPYGGQCTMRIGWAEGGLSERGETRRQTFTWLFRP